LLDSLLQEICLIGEEIVGVEDHLQIQVG